MIGKWGFGRRRPGVFLSFRGLLAERAKERPNERPLGARRGAWRRVASRGVGEPRARDGSHGGPSALVGAATTTSAFAYAPTVTDDESDASKGDGKDGGGAARVPLFPCGAYAGSFDMLTHQGLVRTIKESAVFSFESKENVVAVTAEDLSHTGR